MIIGSNVIINNEINSSPMLVAIIILLVLLSLFGVSTKKTKLPPWAEFDPNEYWGVSGTPICDWFECHKRLKIALIKLAQLVIVGALYVFDILVIVTKAFIRALNKIKKSA